jgi:hypothetical protein
MMPLRRWDDKPLTWREFRTVRPTRTNVLTAMTIVVFWPAAFFVGGDKQNAAELAQSRALWTLLSKPQSARTAAYGVGWRNPHKESETLRGKTMAETIKSRLEEHKGKTTKEVRINFDTWVYIPGAPGGGYSRISWDTLRTLARIWCYCRRRVALG